MLPNSRLDCFPKSRSEPFRIQEPEGLEPSAQRGHLAKLRQELEQAKPPRWRLKDKVECPQQSNRNLPSPAGAWPGVLGTASPAEGEDHPAAHASRRLGRGGGRVEC